MASVPQFVGLPLTTYLPPLTKLPSSWDELKALLECPLASKIPMVAPLPVEFGRFAACVSSGHHAELDRLLGSLLTRVIPDSQSSEISWSHEYHKYFVISMVWTESAFLAVLTS
jgi:hypothetical protein